MEERFLHVDMNAFFASVEQARNPDLKGKPVIVCGDPNGRGVVSAASYEARRYGVHSAMPAATAKRLCPNGVFISTHMADYGAVSRSIMKLLAEFTPVVEPVSIDEAFLDLLGCDLMGTPVDVAHEIKRRIREGFGLTCSIGIAKNRLLAKMASEMQKPDGLVVLRREDLETRVWPLPVDRLIGVGEKTAKRLMDLGIMTIGQLARAPLPVLAEKFGVSGEALALMARGEEDMGWSTHAKQKSLGRETTFARDIANQDTLRKELLILCEDVGARLRESRYQAKGVSIKYRYPDFSTYTRAKTLDDCVDTTEPLFRASWDLLRENVADGQPLRLIGVTAFGLVEPDDYRQAMLPLEPRSSRPVHKVLDSLRHKYGNKIVVRGSVLDESDGRPE